uniref:ATP-dependent DNA helicase n=1 Tax=Strongyloides venezuelensis TaxID=75913 RepID=A0A0K0FFQ4_STRVS
MQKFAGKCAESNKIVTEDYLIPFDKALSNAVFLKIATLIDFVPVIEGAQIILSPAIMSSNFINLMHKLWNVTDKTIVCGTSYKHNILIYKVNFKSEEVTLYADGSKRIKKIRQIMEYESEDFACFSYYFLLNDRIKDYNKRTWKNTNNSALVTVSGNVIGIDFQKRNMLVHHKIPVLISEYYQDIQRIGRDGKLGIAVLYNTSETNNSHKRQGNKTKHNLSVSTPTISVASTPRSFITSISVNASEYIYKENDQTKLFFLKRDTKCLHNIYTSFFDDVGIDNCLFSCSSCLRKNMTSSIEEMRRKMKEFNENILIGNYFSENDMSKRRIIMLDIYDACEGSDQTKPPNTITYISLKKPNKLSMNEVLEKRRKIATNIFYIMY